MIDPDKPYGPPELSGDERYPLARFKGERPPAPLWYQRAYADAPKRERFRVDNREIELLTWGEVGRPGLLFVHGMTAHADWWSYIAPWFSSQWRCAAISLSGMGGSDWSETYSLDGFADEVITAIDAAQLDRGSPHVLVVGHSFGGSVAMNASAREPRIAGVVCIDTPIAPRWGIPAQKGEQPGGHRIFPDLASALARFRLEPPQHVEYPFLLDHIGRRALHEVEGGWTWRFDPAMWNRLDRSPVPSIPTRVRCPIAYMYGGRSQTITDETMSFMLNVLPAGTPMISLPDADHHLLVDQPLVLVGALRTLFAAWPSTLMGDQEALLRCDRAHGPAPARG